MANAYVRTEPEVVPPLRSGRSPVILFVVLKVYLAEVQAKFGTINVYSRIAVQSNDHT